MAKNHCHISFIFQEKNLTQTVINLVPYYTNKIKLKPRKKNKPIEIFWERRYMHSCIFENESIL